VAGLNEKEADLARDVLKRFPVSDPIELDPIGNGLIHGSYLVHCAGTPMYVLQHLNTHVFRDPELLASNALVVTERIRSAVIERGGDPLREVLQFIQADDGRYLVTMQDGSVWRLAHFVPETVTVDVARNPAEAGIYARAFARFLRDVWDVSPDLVRDTIPGFHDTPRRYRRFREVVAAAGKHGARERETDRFLKARHMVDAINARGAYLDIVERERAEGVISTHVCHNDTKVNNLLLDRETMQPLCVIDLDTAGPGSPLVDAGDLLRTASATASEEEPDIDLVEVDVESANAITGAFEQELGTRLNRREIQLLPFSGWLITVEQAIRYLTDFLENDIYYGERYPGHNLRRTENQLALAISMERDFVDLREIWTE